MSAVFKNYQEWLMSIPLTLSQDSLWRVSSSIVKLLLTMIPRERGYVLHEDPSGFGDEPTNLDALLNAVPLLEDANTHHAPRIKSPHAPA
jgi:hypothetical protein